MRRRQVVEPVLAYVGFGSNLGDRLAYLRWGVEGLLGDTRIGIEDVSPVYETDPVGGPEQGAFLNAVVLFTVSMSPDELLSLALDVERNAGRVRGERWGPRVLDIDLLAFGDDRIETENLVVPHPRIYERAFVLEPLLDLGIRPGVAIDPVRATEALEAIRGQRVRRFAGPNWL